MTNKQKKLLKFLYNNPQTIKKLRKKFNYTNDDYTDWYIFFGSLENQYLQIGRAGEYDDYIVNLSNEGIAEVEEKKQQNKYYLLAIRLPLSISILSLIISILCNLSDIGSGIVSIVDFFKCLFIRRS